MNRKVTLLTLGLLILLSGCSTVKKSLMFGGVVGAATVGTLAVLRSPTPEDKTPNAAVFGTLGALAGATAAYLIHQDQPQNVKLKPMLPEPKGDEFKQDSTEDPKEKLINLAGKGNLEKRYSVPVEPLPNELKDKVKKQVLEKYVVPEETIYQDGATYVREKTTIYKHTFAE